MNIYEAQDFFKKMYPEKDIKFDFDDYCIRLIECIYTDGYLHPLNHVQYEKVKMTVEGMDAVYVPIQPHRMLMSATAVKKKFSNDVVYIHPEQIENIKTLMNKNDPILNVSLNELSDISGYSVDQIMEKVKLA